MKRQVKHFLIYIFIIIQVSMVGLRSYASTNQFLAEADTLYNLSLFKGTFNGYELDRVSNRVEAAVMLVRLLGKEQQAYEELSQNSHPFVDVPEWANSHITYLYNHGLTKGISATLFGSQDPIIDIQYTTMLLRALGYNDGQDFSYSDSIDFAKSVGLLGNEDLQYIKQSKGQALLRDYIVKMSYNSLFTKMKGSSKYLLSELASTQVIPAHKADELLQSIKEQEEAQSLPREELRGVWISYIELQEIFKKSGNEQEFLRKIQGMFDEIKDSSFNTVFVQVRAFGDAFYESNLFPWSYIISGEEGNHPGYDPLEIMVTEAHARDLKIEAWINPYRIRTNTSIPLSDENVAAQWLEEGNNHVISLNNGLFYNPASDYARSLIIDGVNEIIVNYDVDGIHFDDYFYPSASLEYDLVDYANYHGPLTHKEWRRENVNQLIRDVYEAIKKYDENIRFGISPQGNIKNNYDQQFIDVEKWLANDDYIDYICPQIYYGFNNQHVPFQETFEAWDAMIQNNDIDLYVGLAGYKIGREDRWAGDGKDEWLEDEAILKRMVLASRDGKQYQGFVIFRYGTLWEQTGSIGGKTEQELLELTTILQ